MEMLKTDVASPTLYFMQNSQSWVAKLQGTTRWKQRDRLPLYTHLTVIQIFAIKIVILLYERER